MRATRNARQTTMGALDAARSIISPLRGIPGSPPAQSKQWRLMSCTQTSLKRKPLRIGRSCSSLKEINSVAVDPAPHVSLRKERRTRKQ